MSSTCLNAVSLLLIVPLLAHFYLGPLSKGKFSLNIDCLKTKMFFSAKNKTISGSGYAGRQNGVGIGLRRGFLALKKLEGGH